MSQQKDSDFIEKVKTGISGFDLLSEGGLPKGRTTLVAGTAGSAKTVFACQFLVKGIQEGQNGVFVTFEESPQAIRKNMRGFGWDIEQWEAEEKWAFVDASPKTGNRPLVSGEYDLSPLLARLEYAIEKVKAQRVSMDSLGAIFSYVPDVAQVRSDLFDIAWILREREITSVLTSERTQEYGEISRYGVEEFVADNVVILRNILMAEKRRRTVEILKYRGTPHLHGEFPFTILSDQGIVVIPYRVTKLERQSSKERVTSGNTELDAMCGGGFFRDSIILISGATGTGKTLMVTEFLAGGVKNQAKCLLFCFEESRQQLFRNATGWGIDFEEMESAGNLNIFCRYPQETGLENHLVTMKQIIDDIKPQRLAIDSISALSQGSTPQGFREFILGLNSIIKKRRITGLFTANTSSLMGSSSVTESQISTNTDVIILLRYVEVQGEIHRVLTILKMRGSKHHKEIRGFLIDDYGMHIGKAFQNVTGILSGNPSYVNESELNQLSGLFD